MKPSTNRRVRRRNAGRELGASKNDSRQQMFFGDPAVAGFFQPQAAIQRKCKECEEEDKKAQRMPDNKAVAPAHQNPSTDSPGITANTSPGRISSMDNGGSTMSTSLQAFFGARMQYNFADVKIHNGEQANQSAKDIHAQAYTYGNHIVFADGKFNPSTEDGKKLLAHELTHVMQQHDSPVGLHRQVDDTQKELETVSTSGQGPLLHSNTTHYGCEGVSVQGHTDANYSNSFNYSGSGTRATGCEGCSDAECVTNTGTIVSTFDANPSVTLPSVPDGLSECETNAVQNFIDTTLSAHEQQHVAAFNTYDGTVNTPYTYHGCASGEEAYVTGIHNGIEQARKAASDAASAALDPFNATIPCDCPEPEAAESSE